MYHVVYAIEEEVSEGVYKEVENNGVACTYLGIHERDYETKEEAYLELFMQLHWLLDRFVNKRKEFQKTEVDICDDRVCIKWNETPWYGKEKYFALTGAVVEGRKV